MNLEQAIAYTIQQEGPGIVGDKRFVNYLHDLGAFEQPAMKRILSVMVEGGYCSKLISAIANNTLSLVAKDSQMRLVQIEGLHSDMVAQAISKLCSAFGQPLSLDTIETTTQQPQTKDSIISKGNELTATLIGDSYKVEFNGKTYFLSKIQYKSILRKKNCPAHILESWLTSYSK